MEKVVTEPIAIIGLGCRLPIAIETPGDFWTFLVSGDHAIRDVPPDRWGDRYFDKDRTRAGRSYTRSGAFLSDITQFDSAFFGLTPREAEWMDPQQRLLLEVAWHAFEDAGLPAEAVAGSDTGVFIGTGTTDFPVQRSRDIEVAGPYTMTGIAASITANRLSYVFDLRGPSLAVDTACSSGLVALHQAVQTLQAGQAHMALVGAVNLLLEPFPMVGFAKAGMLSASGRCHSFDARADGYVRGEGAVAIVLKPLSAARTDGDHIHAVILGSAVNSDGHTQGITLPNQTAQEAVLRQAYAQAGIAASEIDYVEAHGTGTPVGDPIECAALGHALGAARGVDAPLAIGSVKPQTGHLEFAAGLVGLLKAVLVLKHRMIPATADFSVPNPAIAFSNLNLRVVDAPISLAEGRRGVVGINSFGFGGTNAHVVLAGAEPAPTLPTVAEAGDPILLLSAKSEGSLRALATRFVEHLNAPSTDGFANMCWTAARCRSHHAHRLAVHSGDARAAAAQLSAFLRNDPGHEAVAGTAAAATPRKLALVFNGNGAQWLGMGVDLYRQDAAAGEKIDHIAAAMTAFGGADIRPVFAGTAEPACLAATDLAQPALFALQVATVDWLKRRGMKFSAVLGHSVGELAAAYVAGALRFEDAIRVLDVRSRAQHRTVGGGKMLVVALSSEEALRRVAPLFGAVAIAAINAPESVTLSGEAGAIDAIAATLMEDGIAFRRLDLNYAFHCPLMDPIEAEVRAGMTALSPQPTKMLFASTVTGALVPGEALDADYWWRNIREPVLFTQALATLQEQGFDLFVEIGPAAVLSGNIRESLRATGASIVALPTLRREKPALPALRRTLGRLYVEGAQLDYDRFPPWHGTRADLPAYPFDRRRHWVERRGEAHETVAHPEPVHPLLGDALPTARPCWQAALDTGLFPFLADHQVQGTALLPATAYIEICLAAAQQVAPGEAMTIADLTFSTSLLVEAATTTIETAYAPDENLLTIRGKPRKSDAQWVLHAQARLRTMGHVDARFDLKAARERCSQARDAERFYRDCAQQGLDYGPAFRTLDSVWIGENEVLGRLTAEPAGVTEGHAWHLPPHLADACLQLATVLPGLGGTGDQTFVPVGIENIRLLSQERPAFCHVVLHARGTPRLDGRLMDVAGTIICEMRGIALQALPLPPVKVATALYRERLVLIEPPVRLPAMLERPSLSPQELIAHATQILAELASSLKQSARSADWQQRFDALCAAWAASPTDAQELWCALLADAPERLSELFLAAQLFEARSATEAIDAAECLSGATARSMLAALYDLAPVSRCWAKAVAALVLRVAAGRPQASAFRMLIVGAAPQGLIDALRLEFSTLGDAACLHIRADHEDANATRYDLLLAVDPADADLPELAASLRKDGLLLAWERRFGVLEHVAGGSLPIVEGQALRPRSAAELATAALAACGFTDIESIPDRSGLDSGRLLIARRRDDSCVAPPVAPALWLLVTDESEKAAMVARHLAEHGQMVVTAACGDIFQRCGDRQYEVDANRPEDFRALCAALAEDGLEPEHVVFLYSLQSDPVMPLQGRDRAALHLIQALQQAPWLALPRLTLVTAGAFGLPGHAPAPAQAPLWGVGRVAMSETSAFRIRLINLAGSESCNAESLAAELLWPCDEEEVVWAEGERYAVRVGGGEEAPETYLLRPTTVEDVAFSLAIERPGALDTLHFAARESTPALGACDVAIRVHAAGLNFRDLAWALRLLPEEAMTHGLFGVGFGLECAGIVERVGEAVDHLRPGDRVVAMGPGCLATRVVQHAGRVHLLPDHFGFEEAASLPVALTTALYALDEAAHVQRGETILVHAAAGGVGLAATGLALARGARVLATAGSPEKRAFVKRLGVEAVFDSRMTSFADDILAYTDGEGVDVVLNSLSGAALEAGLAILKPFGRFVEIGKRDLYADRRVGLRPLRRHGAFHAVDMDLLMQARPDEAGRVSRDLGDLLAQGTVRGLPLRSYPFARVAEAFRAMQRGAHIGKIVLSAEAPLPVRRSGPRQKLRFGGSILVTGGFGGFGLATARWLVEKGATHLILVGRSAPRAEAAELLAMLRQGGATVDEEVADVADYAAMRAIFARANGRGRPITGVIHAAAIYDDAILANQDWERFEKVMRPKAVGAYHLHRLTTDLQLDFFVLYSSVSYAMGSGGQANYVAANAYLEALAAWRVAQGLPALAVGFGPIADAGYLARNKSLHDDLSARWGMAPLRAEAALARLETLLLNKVSGSRIIVSWAGASTFVHAGAALRSRFRGLVEGARPGGQSESTPLADWPQLTPAERRRRIENFLAGTIGKILRLDVGQMQPERALGAYGLDSLMAVEVSLVIETALGIDMRALELTSGNLRTVAARLVDRLDRKLGGVSQAAGAEARA